MSCRLREPDSDGRCDHSGCQRGDCYVVLKTQREMFDDKAPRGDISLTCMQLRHASPEDPGWHTPDYLAGNFKNRYQKLLTAHHRRHCASVLFTPDNRRECIASPVASKKQPGTVCSCFDI